MFWLLNLVSICSHIQVFKNLKLFMEHKNPDDDLFDRISVSNMTSGSLYVKMGFFFQKSSYFSGILNIIIKGCFYFCYVIDLIFCLLICDLIRSSWDLTGFGQNDVPLVM